MNQLSWLKHGSLIAAALVLAGCESAVSVNLTFEQPSDYEIEETVVSIRGVEFQKSGGGSETLEFRDPEPIQSFDYLEGDTLRLFTDEELSTGTYTGVRLLLDDDEDASYVIREQEDLPLTLTQGEFAPVSFQIEDEENDEFSFTLVLDMRQSLREPSDDEFALTPVLRAVDPDEAGDMEGTVEDNCTEEEAFGEEAAVYVYAGSNVTPDDRGGTGTAPYATAGVFFDTTLEEYIYYVPALAPGNYTVALACRGDREDPAADDDLEFTSIENVEIEETETLRHDIGS